MARLPFNYDLTEKITLDDLDGKILDELQNAFPLEEKPYNIIAARLGIDVEKLWARISKLVDDGVIRRIGASLNSKKLGYASTLAAVRVPVEILDHAAEVVGSYCEVTHSYLRDDVFNIWFTLIAVDEERIEAVLKEIQIALSLNEGDVLNLPTIKLFIGESRHEIIQQGAELLGEVEGLKIRAALVLLSFGAVCADGDKPPVDIATAVELFHIADAMHDRTIDSVKGWSSDISLVFGDYLYSQAYRLIAQCSNVGISACLSDAIARICEYDLTNLCMDDDSDVDSSGKTSIYYSVCCQIGAICGHAGDELAECFKQFGGELGMAGSIERLGRLDDSEYKRSLADIAKQLCGGA